MTKKDVGIINEIGMVVGQVAGEKAKQTLMKGSEKMADATPEEVAEWLRHAMDTLDTLVEEKARIQIMENCGFNCAEMNRSHIDRARARREKFKTLEEFLEAEEKNPTKGTRLVRDGDMVYQYYDPRSSFNVRCFCSVWRGLKPDETVSLTWCQCSKGFVMKLWEVYLGRPAKIELIESCIAGSKECKFAVYL
ncbi:MAG: hypothetical protein HXS40_02700 [Theionarchaea archaeon]|nr:hypothetical protein [Theionarchaea archaeon]